MKRNETKRRETKAKNRKNKTGCASNGSRRRKCGCRPCQIEKMIEKMRGGSTVRSIGLK